MFTLLKWYLTFWDCFWKALQNQEVLNDNYSQRDKNTTYYKQAWHVLVNWKIKESQNNDKVKSTTLYISLWKSFLLNACVVKTRRNRTV